jgi:hypothetical protein
MVELEKPAFDAEVFLTSAGFGRRVVKLREKHAFFPQGEADDSVFYLQSGRAKLTVVAKNGKEATITLLSAGEFVGEESLASVGALHMATATTDCTALKIERGDAPCDARGASPCRCIHLVSSCARNAHPVRPCRPTLQLQRKMFGEDTPVDGEVWRIT